MKKKYFCFNIAVSLFFACLLASCHYKEFCDCDSDMSVKFVYDYSDIDFQPKMMRLSIKPLEGQMENPMIRDFVNEETIDMLVGNYHLVAFNNDSGILRYSGYDTIDGKTMITSGLADRNKTAMLDTIPGAEFYDYPDRVAYVDMDTVEIPMPTSGCQHTIVLKPQEATQQVHVTIEGLRNMQLLLQTEFCLDSCYIAFLPESKTPDTKTSYVVSPDVKIDAANNIMTGTFNIFGMPHEENHTLRLAIAGNGFRHVLRFNTNGKIEHKAGSRDIYINIKKDLDINSLVNRGGTFDIDIDNWKTDSTEIRI